MITIRKSADRGISRFSWLDSRHSFSFGEYDNPNHRQFGPLRVINEDMVAPGAGFPTHPHREMEIVTWVLSGALAHKDNSGGQDVIRPGDIQRMSAGTGITHSEFNASATDPVHLLQIWLLPAVPNLTPGYEQKAIPLTPNGLTLLAAHDGRHGAVTIHQTVDLWAATLAPGQTTSFTPAFPTRIQWLQVAQGGLSVNGIDLSAGDGAAITGESALTLHATSDTQALIFDMAA